MKNVILSLAMAAAVLVGSTVLPKTAEARPWGRGYGYRPYAGAYYRPYYNNYRPYYGGYGYRSYGYYPRTYGGYGYPYGYGGYGYAYPGYGYGYNGVRGGVYVY